MRYIKTFQISALYLITRISCSLLIPKRTQLGFTLIELMIVVGIIGIMVSIAGPQYERYQRKTRQSEAKIALSSMYGLQKAFYSEYSAYTPDLVAIGFSEEGSRRIYQVGTCITDAWTGSVTGKPGFSGTTNSFPVNPIYTMTWSYGGGCGALMLCSAYGNDSQVFVGDAFGQLKSTGSTDVWTINQIKVLTNCSSGI